MTDQERTEKINEQAAKHLQDFALQLENEEINEDDILAICYASLVISTMMGFSPEAIVDDAKKSAEKLGEMIEKDEE